MNFAVVRKARFQITNLLQLLAATLSSAAFAADDFEAVIEKYGPMVYRVAMSDLRNVEDAEDCYQEVFLRYVRQSDKISSEEHCKAWLLRVTINCCHDMRRSPHFSKRAEWSDAIEASMGEEDNTLESLASDATLAQILQKLSPEEARAIHLFYFEEMSIKEIAELSQEGQSAVKVRLHRARKKLKDYWQ